MAKILDLKKIVPAIVITYIVILTILIFISVAEAKKPHVVKDVGFECTARGKKWACTLPPILVKRSVSIFGTEYMVNDNATIFLQLVDEQEPVQNATCLIDLYYPDKTKWLEDAAMVHKQDSDGLYYYDLVMPNQTGIYMMTAKCFYVTNYYNDYADAFGLITGVAVSGDYSDTWKDDNVFHSVKEKLVGGGYSIDFYYNFTNMTQPANYSGMLIKWIGKWDSWEESVLIHLWDFCNNSWSEHLPNNITTNTPMVSNWLPSDEWNISCFLRDSTVKVKFHDHDPSEKTEAGRFDTDYLDVQLVYLSYGQMELIRGGGELHVSRGIALLNSTIMNKLYSIQDEIAGINVSVGNVSINITFPTEMNISNYSLDNISSSFDDVIALLFALHSTPVSYQYCENDTLVVTKVANWTVKNKIYPITKVERINCMWGCANSECMQPPYIMIAISLGIVIFIIFIWGLLRGR